MFLVFPRLRMRISLFALPMMLVMLWLEGVFPFAVTVMSAFLHETGHITAMRYCGYRARRIDILPMGALIVCPEGISYKDEILIALSGPLVSLFTAFIASLIFSATGEAIALYALLINLVLGLFNLLPVEKLDGGKAFGCLILQTAETKTAKRICFAVSVVAKSIFLMFAFVCAESSGFNLGVILLCTALLVQILFD